MATFSYLEGHYTIGYCNCCNKPLMNDFEYLTANLDDILFPYYGKQKLAYCSNECFEKDVKFVLKQLKQKRNNLCLTHNQAL